MRQSNPFPLVGLRIAVAKVRSLDNLFGTNPMSRRDAILAMGYARADGTGGSSFNGLKAYGLLEPAGDGLYRVSGRARSILVTNPGSDEMKAALKEAALVPESFRMLAEHEHLSDAELENVVVNSGMSEFTAKVTVAAYRASMRFASSGGVDYKYRIRSSQETPTMATNNVNFSINGTTAKINAVVCDSAGFAHLRRKIDAIECLIAADDGVDPPVPPELAPEEEVPTSEDTPAAAA